MSVEIVDHGSIGAGPLFLDQLSDAGTRCKEAKSHGNAAEPFRIIISRWFHVVFESPASSRMTNKIALINRRLLEMNSATLSQSPPIPAAAPSFPATDPPPAQADNRSLRLLPSLR